MIYPQHRERIGSPCPGLDCACDRTEQLREIAVDVEALARLVALHLDDDSPPWVRAVMQGLQGIQLRLPR